MRRPRIVLLVAYLGAFLAMTTIWIAGSLRRPPDFAIPPSKPGWAMRWGRSAVQFRRWSAPVPNAQATDPFVQQAGPNASGSSGRGSSGPADLYAHSSGYYFARGMAHAFHEVAFHYYVLWWATAPAPFLAAIAYARHRRRLSAAAIRCVACGYDLRATPHRCPECGRVAKEPTATTRP